MTSKTKLKATILTNGNGHGRVTARTYRPFGARVRHRNGNGDGHKRKQFNLAELKDVIRQDLRDGYDEMRTYRLLEGWNRTRPSGKRWTKRKCEELVGELGMEVFFEQHPDLVPLPKKHPYEERDGWGNPPRTESDDKYGHYYMKSNAFVDWRLPIPATVYRVWDALQRHANKQPGRLVRRVSIELLSAECYQQSRTITKAVNYLDAIRGIKILVKGGSRHQGGRLTSVYLVPSLAALCMPVLLKAIKATPYRGFRMKD